MAREMKDSGAVWIGKIPVDWVLSKVSHFYEIQLGKMLQPTQKTDNDTFERYLCAANVGQNTLKTDDIKQMWFSSQEKGLYNILPGDLLVVEGGDVASSDIVSADLGEIYFQNSLHRVRSINGFDVRFLRFWLIAAKACGYIDLICNKATIAHFSKEKFSALPFPVVSISEQIRIVEVLNLKCAEIDTVLEKTRTSISEYKKLKQAIITQAVTKGVRGDRPMKESGIEWVGRIPADWDVRRIKTLFSLRDERNTLPLAEVNLISLYTDQGVLQHADLEKTTGNKASNADGYKKVYQNDIIVNIILCWMGAIGRSDFDGVTSPAYDVYIPTEEVESRFYHYYFRTTGFNGDCYKRGRGIMAMRWRTYSDQFRDIPIVFPPIGEQQAIVKHLDKMCSQVDALILKSKDTVVDTHFLTILKFNFEKIT